MLVIALMRLGLSVSRFAFGPCFFVWAFFWTLVYTVRRALYFIYTSLFFRFSALYLLFDFILALKIRFLALFLHFYTRPVPKFIFLLKRSYIAIFACSVALSSLYFSFCIFNISYFLSRSHTCVQCSRCANAIKIGFFSAVLCLLYLIL